MADLLERFKVALADRYTIERELGAGGMATVYLAEDLKHHRKVAVKVLRPELSAILGTERFLQEIEVTANLQHPHILPLHDSGEADGFLYYVMPYVEGESLRDKLNREKQLSIAESVAITRSVAAALDYAHRRHVIHRDIKPENILLHDGQPVVADFGIGLAVTAAGGTRLTESGMSLGTPAYMSPEQATGEREIDGRSDVYSLASVLYEMLAGEPPHTGSTAQAILAKVVTDRPRLIVELRDTVPVHVAAAVHKGLAKVPADRFATAADFEAAVTGQRIVTMPEFVTGVAYGVAASRSRWLTVVPWALVVMLLVFVLFRIVVDRSPAREVRYVNITLPDSAPLMFIGESFAGVGQTALALSPDGRHLAYVGPRDTTTQLYVRSLDGFETRALPGTEGAETPFFSPDGEWIGFISNHRLYKVSRDGEQVAAIADAPIGQTASWSEEGRIANVILDALELLLTNPTGTDAVRMPLSVEGQQPRQVQWLPGGEWLVGGMCSGAPVLCLVHADNGESRLLTVDGMPDGPPLEGTDPRYVPGGYIVYSGAERNVVLGVRFDPVRLAVVGEPVELVRGVRRENFQGNLQMALSANGDLVYAPGANAIRGHLIWADRMGNLDTLNFPPRVYGQFRLSPDGTRLAVKVTSELGDDEIWFLDLAREQAVRFNPGDLEGIWWIGSWLPDSRSILTWLQAPDTSRIVQVDALRPSGGRVRWTANGPAWVFPSVTTRDSTVFVEVAGETFYIARTSLDELDRLPADPLEAFPPIVDGPGNDGMADASPDGRWLVYCSDETGPLELYAQRLDSEEPPHRLSYGGSEWSLWSPRGDGIYQRIGQDYYWVPFTGDLEQPFGERELVVEGNFLNVLGLEMAVSPDGNRILLLEGLGKRTTTQLNLVVNWIEVLKERLGN